jgi:hypothetical protein
MMARTLIYIGLNKDGRTMFTCESAPTRASHGVQYQAVIGPFRTESGAIYMRDRGANNPHCQGVEDAERLAIALK